MAKEQNLVAWSASVTAHVAAAVRALHACAAAVTTKQACATALMLASKLSAIQQLAASGPAVPHV